MVGVHAPGTKAWGRSMGCITAAVCEGGHFGLPSHRNFRFEGRVTRQSHTELATDSRSLTVAASLWTTQELAVALVHRQCCMGRMGVGRSRRVWCWAERCCNCRRLDEPFCTSARTTPLTSPSCGCPVHSPATHSTPPLNAVAATFLVCISRRDSLGSPGTPWRPSVIQK